MISSRAALGVSSATWPYAAPVKRLPAAAQHLSRLRAKPVLLDPNRTRLDLGDPLGSSRARRAAATARSTSAEAPSATAPMTRSLDGSRTSNVRPLRAPTQEPSISRRRGELKKSALVRAIFDRSFSSAATAVTFVATFMASSLEQAAVDRFELCVDYKHD